MTVDSRKSLVIEPERTERDYWAQLWRYRELFTILAWRDVSVRYKQSVLGISWAVVRPLATMVVLTVIFGGLAGLPSEGEAPYALMVFVGMLAWTLFQTALTLSSESLVSNVGLIGKVFFPRMIVPAAAVVTALIDFLFGLLVLVLLLVYYGYAPGWNLITLPLLILLAVIVSLGPGMLFSALNVKYRDFRQIVPFIAQMGMYVTPVAYSSSVVPERWRLIYSFNPMVGVVDGFRWSILGSTASPLYVPALVISVSMALLFLALGISRFRKMERTFADTI